MNKEELYDLALNDVPKYSLLNEILAIRDKRVETVDYTIGVNGFISLDVLNNYVNTIQENQQLKEQLKDENTYCEEADKWYKEAFEIEQERIKLKSILEEIREYIENHYEDRSFDEIHNEILQIIDKTLVNK